MGTEDILLEGFDRDLIELEDQGFFEDDYECEVYYDVYEWNGARTARTSDITYAGSTISPVPYLDENEVLDKQAFINAIRHQIQKAIDDEERLGPVYVVA